MVRDQLETLAPHFVRQGFQLSELALHTLGSCNRLIMLEGPYVELLGWPAGAAAPRQEIAQSALGLEALVFRSHDAQATYRRLSEAGLAVNPVQDLARTARVADQEVQVRFRTVRFAEQPVDGLRLYFCQHLTPGYVWLPELMRHPNGATRMVRIMLRSPTALQTAQTLALIADAPYESAEQGWDVVLDTMRLCVVQDDQADKPSLSRLILQDSNGVEQVLDTGV